MKRKGSRSSHAWTKERRARYEAKIAARRNGRTNGRANGRPDEPVQDVETARMEHVLVNLRSLSDAGRAYVIARIEEDVA